MRITESQLRQIVREEILREGLSSGQIVSPAEFEQLQPGDRITIDGELSVVVEYSGRVGVLKYVFEGTRTLRKLYVDNLSQMVVEFVSPGAPVENPRWPTRNVSPKYGDLPHD